MGTKGRPRSIASYARGRALALAVLAATGCGEPMVDVVAVWVDGVADDQGNRHVRIYDAGDRDELPVVPDIPGTSLDLLHVGVDDRGQATGGQQAVAVVVHPVVARLRGPREHRGISIVTAFIPTCC